MTPTNEFIIVTFIGLLTGPIATAIDRILRGYYQGPIFVQIIDEQQRGTHLSYAFKTLICTYAGAYIGKLISYR